MPASWLSYAQSHNYSLNYVVSHSQTTTNKNGSGYARLYTYIMYVCSYADIEGFVQEFLNDGACTKCVCTGQQL